MGKVKSIMFYTMMPEQLHKLLLFRHNTTYFCEHPKLLFQSQGWWIGLVVKLMCSLNPEWIQNSETEFLVSHKLSVGVISSIESLNTLSHSCILKICVNFAKGITRKDSVLCMHRFWHKYQKHSFLCVLYEKEGFPPFFLSYIYHQRNLKFIVYVKRL